MIYLDNAATTQMPTALFLKMNRIGSECYGNPSTLYDLGMNSREKIEDCRARIAKNIGALPEEIYFTSGGTESDNWAIRGVLKPEDHIITSAIEHHAVLNTVMNSGVSYTIVNPNKDGVIELKDIMSSATDNTKLISIMMVNNEIGTIQKIKEIGQWARHNGILFHTDAVQAVGHMDIDVNDLSVDLLSASAHKFHGPKGIGFLYINSKVDINPLMYGGSQERGLRPGTENVAEIIGMADALDWSYSRPWYALKKYKEYLIQEFSQMNGVHINGSIKDSCDNIVNIYIENVDSETLMMMLNESKIYVSAGAACNTDSKKPSHVLKAIGCSDERAASSIRISLSYMNTFDELKEFIKKLKYYIDVIRG